MVCTCWNKFFSLVSYSTSSPDFSDAMYINTTSARVFVPGSPNRSHSPYWNQRSEHNAICHLAPVCMWLTWVPCHDAALQLHQIYTREGFREGIS